MTCTAPGRLRSGPRVTWSLRLLLLAGAGLAAGPPAAAQEAPFERVVWAVSASMRGMHDTIEVDRRGDVSFVSVPLAAASRGPSLRSDDRADAAELSRLLDAVRAASVASIPADLGTQGAADLAFGQAFELVVTTGAGEHRVRGELGRYGAWDAELRPVVDALGALAARVRERPTGAVELRGHLSVQGLLRTAWIGGFGDQGYRVAPRRFARDLHRFQGHEVAITGRIQGATFHAEALRSPVRAEVCATVRRDGERVRLAPAPAPGAPEPAASGSLPEAIGPAARALLGADGAAVTVAGWAFQDAGGGLLALLVERVAAQARRRTTLGMDLTWVRFTNGDRAEMLVASRRNQGLAVDEALTIIGVSESGAFYRAASADGVEGWVTAAHVAVGLAGAPDAADAADAAAHGDAVGLAASLGGGPE